MVLIEGISVVIRGGAFNSMSQGSWETFLASAPRYIWADDEIAARSFLTLEEARTFIVEFHAQGLAESDVARVTLPRNIMMEPEKESDWLELGRVTLSVGLVDVARLVGSTDRRIFTPLNWIYAESLSDRVARAAGIANAAVQSRSVH